MIFYKMHSRQTGVAIAVIFLVYISFVFLPPSSKDSNGVKLYSSDVVLLLENGYSNQQDDPLLTDYIFQRWITGPSTQPLDLKSSPDHLDHSQMGQSLYVDQLLDQKTNGFYVECGAGNGEEFSNTLYFEKIRGWGGLLIEANPDYYQEMLRHHRKAFSINACLSTSNKTDKMDFASAGYFGGIKRSMDKHHIKAVGGQSAVDQRTIKVQCFPLYSILAAINIQRIHYFSLDIEGPELEILQTIPFDKVYIDVFSVEYRVWDGEVIVVEQTLKKLSKLRRFFKATGLYKEVGILPWGNHDNVDRQESKGLDVIFKRI